MRLAVDAILVADQVTRGLIPRKGLGDLLGNPLRSRACRDADPDQISTVQTHDQQGIEQVEAKAALKGLLATPFAALAQSGRIPLIGLLRSPAKGELVGAPYRCH